MDVLSNNAIRCNAAGLLVSADQAFLAQVCIGLVHITVALCQCFLAVHHARPALVT